MCVCVSVCVCTYNSSELLELYTFLFCTSLHLLSHSLFLRFLLLSKLELNLFFLRDHTNLPLSSCSFHSVIDPNLHHVHCTTTLVLNIALVYIDCLYEFSHKRCK